jgi:hypothetical protein
MFSLAYIELCVFFKQIMVGIRNIVVSDERGISELYCTVRNWNSSTVVLANQNIFKTLHGSDWQQLGVYFFFSDKMKDFEFVGVMNSSVYVTTDVLNISFLLLYCHQWSFLGMFAKLQEVTTGWILMTFYI